MRFSAEIKTFRIFLGVSCVAIGIGFVALILVVRRGLEATFPISPTMVLAGSGTCVLIAIPCFWPRTFPVVGRLISAAVLTACLLYLYDMFRPGRVPDRVGPHMNRWNALKAFAAFGFPAIFFLVFGGLPKRWLDDSDDGETKKTQTQASLRSPRFIETTEGRRISLGWQSPAQVDDLEILDDDVEPGPKPGAGSNRSTDQETP